jgi:drug/metabolite transporter (DMT)-like permease
LNGRGNLKVLLAFAAIYIIWGTTYLAIRIAVESIPAFLMAGVRFLLAGTLAYGFLRARGVPAPTGAQWRSAGVVGAFLLVGGNGLVTWAEQRVPSGIAALVVATMPLWLAFFDWSIYRAGMPGRRIIFGLLLGVIGIGLLLGPDQIQGTATFGITSLAVLFLAPILWSLGSLISRRATLPENVFMSTAAEMLVGGVLLLIAGLFTGEASRLDLAGISTRSLLATLYLAVFGSIVALTAYVWLLKSVAPAQVATYTYVNPVIAVLLGWLVLDERVTSMMLFAVAIIILAVIIITSHKKRMVSATVKSGMPLPAVSLETAAMPKKAAAATTS